MKKHPLRTLREEIVVCTVCASQLPLGPRPIVQLGDGARIVIIGQAPGSKVHESGIPWRDPSGDRLREWMNLPPERFYDATKIALMPMGFCYPGKGASGDLPPRPECAPLWHSRIIELLPVDRLTLLVGSYAQAHYLPKSKRSMTDNVRAFRDLGANLFPLPHPSWRVVGWAKRNPWFEQDVLPALQAAVKKRLR
jgi:uracil-DNA glycosylase